MYSVERWKWFKCIASKLLDGDSSAGFVSWFCFYHCSFCFCHCRFWKKDHKGWTKPAIPWAAFSAGILGVGIMMGAAWAYESLTFGGYWAWDPVENASLVPWLVLVAGLHTNLIYSSSGYSLKSTYVFYILSFLLILYSTFLTRSGVLGDTSVHAFTDLGMNFQLVCYSSLVFLITCMSVLFIKKYKEMYLLLSRKKTLTAANSGCLLEHWFCFFRHWLL